LQVLVYQKIIITMVLLETNLKVRSNLCEIRDLKVKLVNI
jgi:hypothetical protein